LPSHNAAPKTARVAVRLSEIDEKDILEVVKTRGYSNSSAFIRAAIRNEFLAAERGIPHDSEQHAAYVGSWIKTLRQDKNEIFRAAHDASAATDYLLALERDRSIADEALAAGPTPDSPGSGPAGLEEQTQRLERDREDDLEADSRLEADHKDSPADDVPLRESTNDIARWELGSGTVKVEEKQTGTERRSTVDTHSATAIQNGKGSETHAGRGRMECSVRHCDQRSGRVGPDHRSPNEKRHLPRADHR
jgi:Arc/MetJ-type ribon-helix-helix transcriptional regulator